MPIQEISKFIEDTTGGINKNFPEFYKEKILNQGYFSKKYSDGVEPGSINLTNFNNFWSNETIKIIYNKTSVNLIEFITLNNIIIQETGGTYKPLSEGINSVNSQNNPGISYAYNKINGLKSSYNKNNSLGNKTCYELFNDTKFINIHGNKKFGNLLKNTNDSSWSGEIFPYSFATKNNLSLKEVVSPSQSFITEADFFKFRGRGFIQTTGRANYKKLISFIISYNGDNNGILSYKNLWKNKDLDTIATESTNNDWNYLFNNTNLIIPCYSIKLHSNNNGNYLIFDLEIEPDKLKDEIFTMGKRINGGNDYANLFTNRTIQILNTLGYT